MTTDNLTTVERIYDAFARRDMDTIMAAMDHSVVIVQDAPLPWAGRYTGHAGLAEFLGRLLSHVELRLDVGELITAGDHIVQIGHTNGRVLSNGKEFHVREVHVWRFRGGLVTSYEVHLDVPRMLKALS
ncbi:hypothetical protein ALI144C_08640 [Actinosynnema sp. ALI-1.44]|uniref:nuclear transport factor 2 family protein n=1 Tax=Actinosynnema sp. ALI-1.44 TaxID=1933779 RepID=UPI00097BB4A3|nr:nuclear transport factor 2 family protein [Actinosynnema sp. ALI-1.44]ONI87454.1 hypothetical protein ALI144C_08640 [Actinosynnema sp. ALI-1.44]